MLYYLNLKYKKKYKKSNIREDSKNICGFGGTIEKPCFTAFLLSQMREMMCAVIRIRCPLCKTAKMRFTPLLGLGIRYTAQQKRFYGRQAVVGRFLFRAIVAR
jgi:hypothetical protein